MLLGVGALGCGASATQNASSAQGIATVQRQSQQYRPTKDGDGDYDNGTDDLGFGYPATPQDVRDATALIRRYYAAAAADDGAMACSLTNRAVVKEIAQPEVRIKGGRTMPRLSCAEALARNFRPIVKELVYKRDALAVVRVRVLDNTGLAILHFGATIRDITLYREHGRWKIQSMLDTALG
jgi:hypothetical protein